MELKITLISLLAIFCVIICETEAGRRRKIIIHVPVKVKQQKHTHTLVKPLHVHHKQTVIKEEKVIKQEIHKPTHHTKEIIQHPIEVHHEIPHHEIPTPIKEHKPIFQEEISHEHLHHHYKHVHPDTSNGEHDFSNPEGNAYHFASLHP